LESPETGELSFEDAFRRLEETVSLLEGGGLTIDDLVTRFEQGMSLVALCRLRLDTAQARLSRLIRDDDDPIDPEVEDDD
jgi:exodeoxyribonuclease VII small subunit